MKRRDALRLTGIALASVFLAPAAKSVDRKLFSSIRQNTDKDATSRYIFDQMITKAKNEHFALRPIGAMMGDLGTLLLGTAYIGGTLEGNPEQCKVDLTGLDCFTFVENILCMARIVKRKSYTITDLINEVTMTRYRGGKLTDYTSRLHYASEWAADNIKKKTMKDMTQELGGVILPIQVSFMSEHPQYYPALKDNPQLIQEIAATEKNINAQTYYYIPKKDVRKIEGKLKTGDIIAIATNKAGLDYAHIGLILKDKRGKARLLHASVKKKKVFHDTTISGYLKTVESHIGITVLRPLEP